MAPYLMNFRKYLINIWCVLFYRLEHTFDVKTCFQQNRYVFDVIVTSWASIIYYISLNFANISTLFDEIKHLRSRAPNTILYHIIRINKTQLRLKYFLVLDCGGVKFLKKTTGRCSNITGASMTFRCLRSTIFPIDALKNNGMSACNQLTVSSEKNKLHPKYCFPYDHNYSLDILFRDT